MSVTSVAALTRAIYAGCFIRSLRFAVLVLCQKDKALLGTRMYMALSLHSANMYSCLSICCTVLCVSNTNYTMLDRALHRAGTPVHECRQMLHCSEIQADITAFVHRLRSNIAGFTNMSLLAHFMDTSRHCTLHRHHQTLQSCTSMIRFHEIAARCPPALRRVVQLARALGSLHNAAQPEGLLPHCEGPGSLRILC